MPVHVCEYEIVCILVYVHVGMCIWIYVYKDLKVLLQLVTNQVRLLMPTWNTKRKSKIS